MQTRAGNCTVAGGECKEEGAPPGPAAPRWPSPAACTARRSQARLDFKAPVFLGRTRVVQASARVPACLPARPGCRGTPWPAAAWHPPAWSCLHPRGSGGTGDALDGRVPGQAAAPQEPPASRHCLGCRLPTRAVHDGWRQQRRVRLCSCRRTVVDVRNDGHVANVRPNGRFTRCRLLQRGCGSGHHGSAAALAAARRRCGRRRWAGGAAGGAACKTTREHVQEVIRGPGRGTRRGAYAPATTKAAKIREHAAAPPLQPTLTTSELPQRQLTSAAHGRHSAAARRRAGHHLRRLSGTLGSHCDKPLEMRKRPAGGAGARTWATAAAAVPAAAAAMHARGVRARQVAT